MRFTTDKPTPSVQVSLQLDGGDVNILLDDDLVAWFSSGAGTLSLATLTAAAEEHLSNRGVAIGNGRIKVI